jgi:TetR/AcrR family transcriptional repressor of nem operon
MLLSYIDHLEAALRDSPPKQKGQRSRERLKIATARVLEEKGYHAMRVADVTDAAEMAEGSFYVYFKDKADASLTVLTDLLENFFSLEAPRDGARSVYDSIRLTNRRWLSVCRANAGLMRCILQLGDQEPAFAELSQNANRVWYERVVAGVQRRRGSESKAPLLAAYMLGGMMDELVRKMIVYPDPQFTKVLEEMGADDDAVADAASLVWLRIFHPDQPAPADLAPPVRAFSKWLTGAR